VIYVDASVVLARLFAEPRSPPDQFWVGALISSHLLEYEVWNRVHARGLPAPYHDNARELLALVDLVELGPHVLVRAIDPFPMQVRTLDGLHLASMIWLRTTGETVELATYDNRLAAAAQALGIPVVVS
jgi:hypothetical protein